MDIAEVRYCPGHFLPTCLTAARWARVPAVPRMSTELEASGPGPRSMCAPGESGVHVCTWVMCEALVLGILLMDPREECTCVGM